LEKGAKSQSSDEVDNRIAMMRWVIEWPVKQAISKSNSKDSLQAELDRMMADRRRERRQPANLPEIKCAAPGCSNVFRPRRRNHKTCSDACRQALSRTTQASIQ
jgi:hypothetical protein